tara:strand:+ start:956 stop:1162 length:207 start_codon:yes stop_codon:yes gene_type:complete
MTVSLFLLIKIKSIMLNQESKWSDFMKFYTRQTERPHAKKRKRITIKSVRPIYNPIKHQNLKLELGYE